MDRKIEISKGIKGIKHVPGDKSISHRALMIGAIADGITEIESCSNAADPLSTLSCIRQLGIRVEQKNDLLKIYGNGKYGLSEPSTILDVGNSGTTIRLLSGILVGQKYPSKLTGDSSIVKRPMKRIIDPLRLMGANILGTDKNTAPISINPVDELNSIEYKLPIPSAQVKSAILFAGLYANGTTKVIENVKSRDHTERMLGLKTYIENNNHIIESNPSVSIKNKKFFVPGDTSAAAFLISAGLIVPNSEILIKNVGLNPTRKKIIDIFISMGGNIKIENERIIEGEPIGDIEVRFSTLKSNLDLRGSDIVDIIDEIPILSTTALFAQGSLSIHDAKELRAKETDRIKAIVDNLRLLGADVEEFEDGFEYESKEYYSGGIIPSYNDHRIAMSFGIAGLRIPGITISNAECVDISFPSFWNEIMTH